jgi:hypothetical protein
MTLKEKLFNIVFDNAWEYKHENTVPELEQIADDYAIEFLDFAKSETDYDLWETKFDYKGVLYTSKELLEIFKKEKGYE